jgi:hypothetical protein
MAGKKKDKIISKTTLGIGNFENSLKKLQLD